MEYLKFSIVLLFFVTCLTDAKICQEKTKKVDLRDAFGPIRDQDSIGWCYAFAGADILGFELQQKIPKYSARQKYQQVSAVALGFAHNSPDRDTTFWLFQRKMKIYRQLQQDKNLVKKTQQKIRDLAVKQKRLEAKIIKNRPDLKKRYQKYKRVVADCEKQGFYDSCPLFFKDSNRDISALQDFFFDSEEIMQINEQLEYAIYQLRQFSEMKKQPIFQEKDGGHSDDAIKRALKYGICLESELPSDDYSLSQEMQKVLSAKEIRYINKYIKRGVFLGKGISLIGKVVADPDANHCRAAKYLQALFPRLPLKDIYTILKKGFNDQDPFLELYQKSCRTFKNDLKLIPEPHYLSMDQLDGASLKQLFYEIDKTLDKGKPVEFDYQAAILDYGGGLLTEELDKMDSGHASVIVGKQFNCQTGEVEYIVRNSWGYDACEHDLRHFKTPAIAKKVKQVLTTKKQCNKGCNEDDGCLNSCYDAFVVERNKLYRWSKKEVPYRCDKGYYIVSKSLLAKGVRGVTHF